MNMFFSESSIYRYSKETKELSLNQNKRISIRPFYKVKKNVVKKEHPFSIDARESYSERPDYKRILNRTIPEYQAKPEDVFVVGDIFFYLSLPHRLGMNCILIRNELEDGFRAPKVFI